MRIKNWTKLNAEQLWLAWRAQFESDDAAVAAAVWTANRLIKASARSTRRKFYSIKDEFLRRQETSGRLVRHEVDYCRACGGDGGSCERCDGSGIYRERWLYTHEFQVDGQQYRFHSYQEPSYLLAGIAEDKEVYGGKFTEDELRELALPTSGLVKLLGYVAAAVWGMKLDGAGRYQVVAHHEADNAPPLRSE